jgi:uncharacterized protein (DUF486 family)
MFKVPHHGSKGNVTADLLNHFDCRHFLFSSNGERFGHPDRAAVARVIADKSAKTLHFITLTVFVPFAMVYMGQPFKLDYVWAGLCLVGAVYFIFRS